MSLIVLAGMFCVADLQRRCRLITFFYGKHKATQPLYELKRWERHHTPLPPTAHA